MKDVSTRLDMRVCARIGQINVMKAKDFYLADDISKIHGYRNQL